ncbi:hypothetical protein P781_03215 [Vibrio mimicus CAIM 1883]|nr:hypothetical protein P781_03215 [Vibrio mimicus CAIM 1883]ERM62704.1 hypothetical protein P780_03190 [Vibrio mimicus CAIM 1882]
MVLLAAYLSGNANKQVIGDSSAREKKELKCSFFMRSDT